MLSFILNQKRNYPINHLNTKNPLNSGKNFLLKPWEIRIPDNVTKVLREKGEIIWGPVQSYNMKYRTVML